MTPSCSLFNAHHEPIKWTLPHQWGDRWELVADTTALRQAPSTYVVARTTVPGRSVQVFRLAPSEVPQALRAR